MAITTAPLTFRSVFTVKNKIKTLWPGNRHCFLFFFFVLRLRVGVRDINREPDRHDLQLPSTAFHTNGSVLVHSPLANQRQLYETHSCQVKRLKVCYKAKLLRFL